MRDGKLAFMLYGADGLHDLLLRLGDLTRAEIARRCETPEVALSIDDLSRARRAVALPGPYTSASNVEITGGPGGTSTTLMTVPGGVDTCARRWRTSIAIA